MRIIWAVTLIAGGLFAWVAAASAADGDAAPKQRAIQSKSPPPQPEPQQAVSTESTSLPQSSTSNWTGGQFGGRGGGNVLAQLFADPGSRLCELEGLGATCPETPFEFTQHPKAFTGGLFAGYRVAFGGLVIGIEGDVEGMTGSVTQTQNSTSTTPDSNRNNPPLQTRFETFTGSMHLNVGGSGRGRVGFLISPDLLAYATGGVAIGRLCGSYSYSAVLSSTRHTASGSGSWCDARVGYTTGGGLELGIGGGLTVRLEYRYTDYGSFSRSVPLTAAGSVSPTFATAGVAEINMKTSYQTISVGLGLNF